MIARKNIYPTKMYILITLQYHKQILDFLKSAGFVNHKDYYYLKADIYLDVKEHEYSNLYY